MDDLKMANCDACKELSKVYDHSQEMLVTHFTNKKTGNPTFLIVQGNLEPESVRIAVNFCPWCGRYLRGKEDGK